MTLLSAMIFPVGLFTTFCCVILRFTFWKLHSFVNLKHYFWKNGFCGLSSFFLFSLFCFPFVSPFPLVTVSFPPSTVSSSCYFHVCEGFFMVFFFPLLFFCVPSEWTTPKYWATLSQEEGKGAKEKCPR